MDTINRLWRGKQTERVSSAPMDLGLAAGVQTVFQFDDSWMESRQHRDGSIHLLVNVPRLSDSLKMLAKNPDKNLQKSLKQLCWSHFHKRQTILEIQQVTPEELRHGIGFGAVFCAVHCRPVKVWQLKRKT